MNLDTVLYIKGNWKRTNIKLINYNRIFEKFETKKLYLINFLNKDIIRGDLIWKKYCL